MKQAALLPTIIASLTALSHNAEATCARPPSVSITTISPSSQLQPGDEVIVRGAGFNSLPAEARLVFQGRLGNTIATGRANIRISSDLELRAYVPSDATSGTVSMTAGVVCPGPSANSSSVVFYTLATGPSVTVKNLLPLPPYSRSGAATSDTEVQLSWVAGDATGRTGFRINISQDNGATYQRALEIRDPRATGGTIRGLAPSTTYLFDIAAFGPGGETFTQADEIVTVTTHARTGGSGTLLISAPTGVLCPLTGPLSLTDVYAYFDDNNNGRVEGITGDARRGSFPSSTEFLTDPSNQRPPRRNIFASASYGRNIAGILSGNLVVVGYFLVCGTPQFVSAHFALWDDNGRTRIAPVAMLAGDQQSVVGGERQGAVLEVYDFTVSDAKLVNSGGTPRVSGTAVGGLSFTDWGTGEHYEASVTFGFDAPVERR